MRTKARNRTARRIFKELYLKYRNRRNNRRIPRTSGRSQHWSERLWWIIASGVCLWLCSIAVYEIWTKWNENQVITGLADRKVLISEVPFPTVTICPATKTSMEKLDIVSVYRVLNKPTKNNLSDLTQARMEALAHICSFYQPLKEHFGHEFINETVYKLIQDMAPSINDSLNYCKWRGKDCSCRDLFTPVFTDYGLCFTFNALNSRDIYTDEMAVETLIVRNKPNVSHWHRDSGYSHEVHESTYPFRIFNTRPDGGLTFYPQLIEKDIEYLCSGPTHGFTVILSIPGESLSNSREVFQVPAMQEAQIFIRPNMIQTSDNLRDYAPNDRQCFYSTERPLRFFRFYSYSSCANECLSNFTLRECGCVKFSMPRDKYTRICGSKSVACCKDAANRLYGEDILDGVSDRDARIFREQCDCLPGCTTIEYEGSIVQSKLNLDDWSRAYNLSDDKKAQKPKILKSRLIFAYGDYQVTTLKKSALYTSTDFMAVCGGLLGLYLGLSALNIMQFVYRSAFRAFCVLHKLKIRKKVTPFHRNVAIYNNTLRKIDSRNTEVA